MSTIELIGGILLIISSLLIIIVCLAQSQKQQDMSTALSGQSDNFFGKNGRGSSREESLAALTKVAAAVLFIITIAVNIIGQLSK